MKILVGYDGSNVSKAALDLSRIHAKAFDAKVYVIFSMIGGREIPRQVFVNAEHELAYAENLLKEEKIACETQLSVRGMEAGEDIVSYAGEIRADEIIIGVRRRSRVEKLLMGSTAQYVMINAPCPVVGVK